MHSPSLEPTLHSLVLPNPSLVLPSPSLVLPSPSLVLPSPSLVLPSPSLEPIALVYRYNNLSIEDI